MKRRILYSVIFLLVLTGCAQKENPEVPGSGVAEENLGSPESAGEENHGKPAEEMGKNPENPASGEADGLIPVADFNWMKLPVSVEKMDYYEMEQGWLYLGGQTWTPGAEYKEMQVYRNDIGAEFNPERYITIQKAFTPLAFLADGNGACFVYGQYGENEAEEVFFLEKYNGDGELLWSREYTDEELGGIGAQLRDGCAAADGHVFLYTCGAGGCVISFGEDGSIEGRSVPQLETLEGLAATGNGSVYAYGAGKSGQALAEITGENGAFAAPVAFLKVFRGRGSCLCFCTEQGLWEYDTETRGKDLLWNWDDEYVQLSGEEIEMLYWEEDICHILSRYLGTWMHGAFHWEDDQKLTFAAVSLRDSSGYREKESVTLARSYMADFGSWMEELVRMYNRQSTEYNVKLVSYEENMSDSNRLNQLEAQLLRGEGPDLLELSNVYALNLAEKEVLEDLAEFYEESDRVDWSGLLPPIREGCTLNGRNVLVIPSFYIRSWVSKEPVPMEEWTPWKYQEMAMESQMFPATGPYELLAQCMEADFTEPFVDYEKKECYFDSGEFSAILEAFAQVPSRKVQDERSSAEYLELEYLLKRWDFKTMDEYLRVRDWYGDSADYQGIPGWEGARHDLYATDVFAVNKASRNKAGAWDFLEFLLSREVQDMIDWGFPVREESFLGYLEKSYIHESNEDRGIFNSYFSGPQPEEGDFDWIKDIISASVYTSVVDKGNVVRGIVLEEAGMYFKGDATLEQTVAKIQNRVSLYLKEK